MRATNSMRVKRKGPTLLQETIAQVTLTVTARVRLIMNSIWKSCSAVKCKCASLKEA